MIILYYSNHSPTGEKVLTTSNHYNLPSNFSEKYLIQLEIKPRAFGLPCQRQSERDHCDAVTNNNVIALILFFMQE